MANAATTVEHATRLTMASVMPTTTCVQMGLPSLTSDLVIVQERKPTWKELKVIKKQKSTVAQYLAIANEFDTMDDDELQAMDL